MTQKERANKILAELIGTKFGRLKVIEILDEFSPSKKRIVKCLCDCGNYINVILENIKNGHTNSCGCYRQESAKDNSIKRAHEAQIKSGRVKEPKIASATRVFRERYKDGDLTFEEFYALSQQNCFYCGIKPSTSFNTYISNGKSSKYSVERIKAGTFIYNGLDRIDCNFTHNKNNVVPCCITCNTMKMALSKEDFFNKIKSIYEKHIISTAEAL